MTPQDFATGLAIQEPQCIVLTTEVNLLLWGAHTLGEMVQGFWMETESSNSINFLELRVIIPGLLKFQNKLLISSNRQHDGQGISEQTRRDQM